LFVNAALRPGQPPARRNCRRPLRRLCAEPVYTRLYWQVRFSNGDASRKKDFAGQLNRLILQGFIKQ